MQQVEIFQGLAKPFDFQLAKNGPNTGDFSDLEIDVTLQDLRTRLIISMRIGLKAQARELLTHYKAYALKSSIPFAFISKADELALSRIFPTRYIAQVGEKDFRAGSRPLADYTYDFIPLAALEGWEECRKRHLFSEYEIWTPERHEPDPILIGRRREHPFIYLIARWGEALRPWEELEQESRSGIRVLR